MIASQLTHLAGRISRANAKAVGVGVIRNGYRGVVPIGESDEEIRGSGLLWV